jgi:Mce-associated membrane protein
VVTRPGPAGRAAGTAAGRPAGSPSTGAPADDGPKQAPTGGDSKQAGAAGGPTTAAAAGGSTTASAADGPTTAPAARGSTPTPAGADTAAAPEGRAARTRSALHRTAPWWVVLLVGALALVGLVGSAVLLARPDDAAVRASAVEAAERYTALLTSYDAATLEEDVARVRAVSTDGFADEYAETIDSLRDQITGQSTVSVGTVVGAGLEAVEGDTATVLVAVDQALTAQGQGARTEANRVRMTLVRQGGSWRVSAVERL